MSVFLLISFPPFSENGREKQIYFLTDKNNTSLEAKVAYVFLDFFPVSSLTLCSILMHCLAPTLLPSSGKLPCLKAISAHLLCAPLFSVTTDHVLQKFRALINFLLHDPLPLQGSCGSEPWHSTPATITPLSTKSTSFSLFACLNVVISFFYLSQLTQPICSFFYQLSL